MPFAAIDPQLKKMVHLLQRHALKRLVKVYGNTTNLGTAIKITEPAVRGWLLTNLMSPSAAINIEKITKGQFKREDFRPDLFDLTWVNRVRGSECRINEQKT